MPSLKQIKDKISSVKGTRRITSAMRLIAAVKLQRAQGILNAYRPYSEAIKGTALNVTSSSDPANHELLKVPENRNTLHIVFFTSDRGLCGSFNGNSIKELEKFLKDQTGDFKEVKLSFVGKKGRDYFSKRDYKTGYYFDSVDDKNSAQIAGELAEGLAQEFVEGESDEVVLFFNHFHTAISQEVVHEKILPFDTAQDQESSVDYDFEPSREKILDFLLPKYLRVRIEKAMNESMASEHASRMTAMENATRNADEVIEKLTLQYNKTRQAIITTELMDIVNGTEALKKGGAT